MIKFKSIIYLLAISLPLAIYSQTVPIETTLLELNFNDGSFPQDFVKTSNGFFFTAESPGKGRELWFSDGTQNGTYLVKDINPGNSRSEIRSMTMVGEVLFFVANDRTHDEEIWRSDGTEEGTFMVKDIRQNDSNSSSDIFDLISFNNKLFFSARDPEIGTELWQSDGTEAGTFPLKDIDPTGSSNPDFFFLFKDKLYFFTKFSNTFNDELWVTDGTESGTKMVKDIIEGDGFAFINPRVLTMNDAFVFYANDGENGNEPWVSDGTEEGTKLLRDIYPGNAPSSSDLLGVSTGNTVYFKASDNLNGTELWKTDGTSEGTVMVKNINSNGRSLSADFNAVAIGETIYFFANDGAHGIELWKSDGTESGTVMIGDFNPDDDTLYTPQLYLNEENSLMYYFLDVPSFSNRRPWRSDGTATGTFQITNELRPSLISSLEASFFHFNGLTYFPAFKINSENNELWVTDGTLENVAEIIDVNTGQSSFPFPLASLGKELLFGANSSEVPGRQLFKSDGTPEGTKLVKRINLTGDAIDRLSETAKVRDVVLFVANDGINGAELWRSDGTGNGTYLVKDIKPGAESGLSFNDVKQLFTVIDNIAFFAADGGSGFELWRSDGTSDGTFQIKDIRIGGSSSPRIFVKYKDAIYFKAFDQNGFGLWKTDGTETGTLKIASVPGMTFLRRVGEQLMMGSLRNGSANLWSSDGTSEGTRVISTYQDGLGDDLTTAKVYNEELYFTATIGFGNGDPNEGKRGYFKSDGTPEGTKLLILDQETGFESPGIIILNECGNYIYFGVKQFETSNEGSIVQLWRSDGTKEGTLMVTENIEVRSFADNIECFGRALFFPDTKSIPNLFFTTGEPGSIYQLDPEIVNGAALTNLSYYDNFTVTDDKLFFSNRTLESGIELYNIIPSSITASGDFTDSDSDGVIDLIDACPNTDPNKEVDGKGCAKNQLDEDNDGINNEIDVCPNSEEGATVNTEGCSVQQLEDDDNDGVLNFQDQCPNTSENVAVDSGGCELPFSLPTTNFTIKILNETCVNRKNGQILISAVQVRDYILYFQNNTVAFTNTYTLEGLSEGNYEICLGVPEYPDYRRCFSVNVGAPESISGRSKTLFLDNKLIQEVILDGGSPPFTVFVNDLSYLITNERYLKIPVRGGDRLRIKTTLACEGTLDYLVNFDELVIFPNPVQTELLNIRLPSEQNENTQIEIYDLNNKLLLPPIILGHQQETTLDVSGLAQGVYLLLLRSETGVLRTKFIKK
ncbi:T9SS type A sorting domain-containing protein [Flavobacteriaceae bacterium M23B6Z8]